MNSTRALSTIFLLVLSTLWIYRDAFGQGLCPGLNTGCVGSVQIPCSQGAGTCVEVTLINVPGGINQCDGVMAAYYTFNPPGIWTDCTNKTGFGPCTRTAATCSTVYLYDSEAECWLGDPCFSNPIQACMQAADQKGC